MKLILSSQDFRNPFSRQVILDNLPKPLKQCRLLFIPNEKTTGEKIRRGKYALRMEEFGLVRENVLVFDHEHPAVFLNLDVDAVYISGGNSFATLDRLRRSGFDREVIRLVQAGAVYIGGSAGAHIASRDLSHLTRYDPPPPEMTDFRGLGLFPGILLCHFTSDRQAHFDQLLSESIAPVHCLTDDDSIIFP